MKCNMPRTWDKLPKKDKDIISRVCSDMMKEQLDQDIQTVQEVLIKMACIILHDEFGFRRLRLLRFVGSWRRAYQKVNQEKLTRPEWLDEELARCFPDGGFPQERIDHMKK